MRRALQQAVRRGYAQSSRPILAQPISIPKLDSTSLTPPTPVPSSSSSAIQSLAGDQHPSRLEVPISARNEAASIKLTLRTKAVDIESDSLGFEKASFPYIWLRDVCQGKDSVDQSTKQKIFKTEDIDPDVKPSNCWLDEKTYKLHIEWDRPLKGKPRNQKETSEYALDFLRAHADRDAWRGWYSIDDMELYRTWKQKDISRNLLTIPYEKLMEQKGILTQAASSALFRDGLVLFKNVPTENKTSDGCSLVTLAETLGRTIRTWYGDKTFSVRSYTGSKNIAYTSLPLDLHMDLLHFEDPPRYQFLHALHLHPALEGGASYFVDAYKAAEILKEQDREAFDVLSKENISFEYKNDGHWTFSEKPTFEFSKESPELLYAVNYSPPFQGPLRLYPKPDDRSDPTDRIRSIHSALNKYAEILYDPKLRFEIQMEEGDCIAFDNRRVLHARTGFRVTDENVKGELRWLMGCYVDDTSVRDKYRHLQSESPWRPDRRR